jgi:ZIP family zinc transporter
MNAVLFAFLLTLLAGLASGAGGLVIMFSKLTNTKFLSVCLSFSAGVMLYVAFAEILLESFKALENDYGEGTGYLIATMAFFAGIIIMAVIDKFLPHADEVIESNEGKKGLKRTGIMTAVAIAIHNLPEGLITFMAAMYDPVTGIAVAIAIIIHNVPEGISTAAPIYFSTDSKAKALLVSACAGLTQPLGALIAWLLLRNVFDDIESVFGIAFAAVSGIMVFVAIHELLPAAQKYGKHHLVMKWLFAGMAVMAFSLVVLEFMF